MRRHEKMNCVEFSAKNLEATKAFCQYVQQTNR